MPTSSITVSIPLPGPRARWAAAGIVAGLLTAIVAGPAVAPRPIFATDPAPVGEHTIGVTGTGRVVLTPDIADLRLGVTTTAKTVEDARAANATLMTAVISALKGLGIADRDVQTTTLSLGPVYDYSTNTNPPRLTGYTLTNVVAVTIRDLDVAGDVIDGAMEAGATTLDSITFRVADQTTAEREAREAAMREAKAKAQTLATAAGVSIDGVASISETVAPIPYPVYYGAAAVLRDAATPVEVGTNEISVTVAVVYVIG
ncbi:MAG TPA: SIMPL domain-containing protein [Candidatus Limnocylindrales bacterium]|nr:SIMPL domain-containing protein [Candidatus Limnocylindrales bacterium]